MRYTREDLFGMWSGEAEWCQQIMDELGDTADVDEVSFAYWRGRRDGYEGAAYDIRYGKPMSVYVISDAHSDAAVLPSLPSTG